MDPRHQHRRKELGGFSKRSFYGAFNQEKNREGQPLISCSMVSLAVARSMTSWSTLASAFRAWREFSSPSSSVSFVCCRMAILVPSGMPGMSLSAIALSKAAQKGEWLVATGRQKEGGRDGSVLDFPVPLRPTSAYLCPSFRRSFALDKISRPSERLDLAFAVDEACSPDVTRMCRP